MRTFTAGDVVWGPDPFHDDDPELVLGNSRPWLVLSNEAFPGHGQQYLCCALTSGAGTGLAFLPIAKSDWKKGTMKKTAFVDTETLLTMKHSWITDSSGALEREVVQAARKRVRSYIT